MLYTNIPIHYLKSRPPAVTACINALDDEDLLRMSFVVHAELLKGAQRNTRKAAVLDRLNALT